MINGRKIAAERDRWLETDEGKRCISGQSSGQYLKNRIEMAFIAGIHAAEKILDKAGKK